MLALVTVSYFGAAAALRFNVAPGAASLDNARALVRGELHRRRGADTEDACSAGNIEVRLESGRHYPGAGGLELAAADAGSPGCFKVVWSGAADGSTVIDGGLHITTKWTLVDAKKNLWSTAAPAALLTPKILPVRTLYVDNVRYNRTRDDPSTFALFGSDNSVITSDGYLVTSSAPQSWSDPTSIEIVKQDAFTETRCPIATVTKLAADTAAPLACPFGQKLQGRSPGSTIAGISNVTTYEACQAECCAREHATPPCKGVMYKDAAQLCYLVDRDVLPGFGPGAGYVSNMNPAPVTYRTAVNISQPCLATARGYKYGPAGYPSYLENTGNFTLPGQFYLDRARKLLFATLLPAHAPKAGGSGVVAAVLGLEEVLLSVHDTHDVEWHNVTFEHSAWTQANAEGYVERFSNLFLVLDGGGGFRDPAASVVVARSKAVVFDGCAWTRLGAWGLRIENASQDVAVRYCDFYDLSGGAVMLGSPQDNVAPPASQLARITVADNTMRHLSMEYTGAAAVHAMVVANSTLEHNAIADVGYCGISWNWPAVQGPTKPYPPTDPGLGYNMNNVVANNDVSRFMRDTNDGGGIHSVGYGRNTTYVGNYFHDLEGPGAVSILYIDNNAAGFALNDNVVDNCPKTAMGYYYFQSIEGADAHDNTADGIYARNSGNASLHGLPCNATTTNRCTNVVDVPINAPWPAAAQAIIANSGPRPRVIRSQRIVST